MRRSPLSPAPVLAGVLLAALAIACANPFQEAGTPRPIDADVKTPDLPDDAEKPPPGGWIEGGVIYDKDGSIYGCVGGGNACAKTERAASLAPEPLDLCADVDAIRDAQLDFHDAHGTYVQVKPTPRAFDQLDDTAVPWPARTGFAQLGWAPKGPTRATYWVDAPPGGGFEVHGLARTDDGYVHCFATAELGAVDTPWRPR